MNEWCGEFVPKMVELPVVEVNIDKVYVDLPENTATVEVKRRGRPKKEAE